MQNGFNPSAPADVCPVCLEPCLQQRVPCLTPGCPVRLSGLTSELGLLLNGKCGVVEMLVEEKGRWAVALDDGTKKTFKEENLVATSTSSSSSSQTAPLLKCKTCSHSFHFDCAQQWFADAPAPTCPSCRADATDRVVLSCGECSETFMAFRYPTLLDARQALLDHQSRCHGEGAALERGEGLLSAMSTIQNAIQLTEQASRGGGLPTVVGEDGMRRIQHADGTLSSPLLNASLDFSDIHARVEERNGLGPPTNK